METVEMAKAIVQKWAPIILDELGLGNAENILNKIKVSGDVLETDTFGRTISNYTLSENFSKMHSVYQENSARIVIYAENIVVKQPEHFSKYEEGAERDKAFKAFVFFVLAHELRHFHQLVTGATFKNEPLAGTRFELPYQERWREKDANEFALTFFKKCKKELKQ